MLLIAGQCSKNAAEKQSFLEQVDLKFYLIFIAAIIVLRAIYRIWLVETNNLTLEEIVGAFGHKVMDVTGKTEKVAVDFDEIEVKA